MTAGTLPTLHVTPPLRVRHSYTQHLRASPELVFPLLCPVRECDWIEGWHPLRVASDSGLAETDCVFTTPSDHGQAVWYVTRHEPERGFVEMIKIVPGVTACRLSIGLRAIGDSCEADVTYLHTSLGAEGDAFIAAFTAEFYRNFMQDWETRLNHYLVTGERLSGAR